MILIAIFIGTVAIIHEIDSYLESQRRYGENYE